MTALPPLTLPPLRPCPICGKAADRAHAPFCSPRCADVDLHHWLNGTYAIPAAPPADEGADEVAEDDA